MSIFNEFFKKEKPLFTGLKFGFGSGGGDAAAAGAFASGGNIDGQPGGNGYTYHVFTGPGTLTVPGSKSFDVLLIAGGGSGGATDGSNGAGGGGAGGVVHHSQLTVSGPLSITVGEGGAHPDVGNATGADGGDSTIVYPGGPWTLTAKGGGGGGQFSNVGESGGSAGGGGGNTAGNPTDGTQGTPSSGQNSPFHSATGFNQYGNAGGAPVNANPGNASGGGGAGGVGGSHDSGSDPDTPTSNGGNGRPFSGFAGNLPAFTPLPSAWKTATGPTGLYAGGGAGENPYTSNATSASGGPGGGGGNDAGGQGGANGIQYTGGGGAGMNSGPHAGDGGDGICIVRYQ